MRSRTSPDFAHRCRRCYLQVGFCLCDEVRPVATTTRVVFIRHALESWKTTNTARIAHLALPNAELWDYGSPEHRFEEALVVRPGSWLLFPDSESTSLAPSVRPSQLIVVDGSWPQARRMVQRITALRGLPRLSLCSPPSAADRLRRGPLPEGRSTIEAVAEAISLLEGEGKGQPLNDLHDAFVRRVREIRQKGGATIQGLRSALATSRPPRA